MPRGSGAAVTGVAAGAEGPPAPARWHRPGSGPPAPTWSPLLSWDTCRPAAPLCPPSPSTALGVAPPPPQGKRSPRGLCPHFFWPNVSVATC